MKLLLTNNALGAIECMPEFQHAHTVLLYWSIKDEVPTHEILQKWNMQKRLVLPRVTGQELELREYDPSKLTIGAYGITEPSAEAIQVKPEEINLAIIPGQAFDHEGNRKGHGKGYYDRLLPHLSCIKIGLAPAYRIVDHISPQPWDAPVDMVIAMQQSTT